VQASRALRTHIPVLHSVLPRGLVQLLSPSPCPNHVHPSEQAQLSGFLYVEGTQHADATGSPIPLSIIQSYH